MALARQLAELRPPQPELAREDDDQTREVCAKAVADTAMGQKRTRRAVRMDRSRREKRGEVAA